MARARLQLHRPAAEQALGFPRGVLAFVFSCNEFSIALNLVSQSNATVPVVVAKFAQDYEIQHGQMAAASILATIPALVLMVFGQRFIVQGLTMGSVK